MKGLGFLSKWFKPFAYAVAKVDAGRSSAATFIINRSSG